jgi:hypothetical protein
MGLGFFLRWMFVRFKIIIRPDFATSVIVTAKFIYHLYSLGMRGRAWARVGPVLI